MGDVAKDAKGNVADVAGRFGSAVKNRWAFLREPATRHALQENLITAAATTGMFLRKGLSDTKEKVAVGKTKVEEVILLENLKFIWYMFLDECKYSVRLSDFFVHGRAHHLTSTR